MNGSELESRRLSWHVGWTPYGGMYFYFGCSNS